MKADSSNRRFQEWCVLIRRRVLASSHPRQWLDFAIVFSLVIAAFAWLPPFAARFQLRPTVPALLLALTVVSNVYFARRLHAGELGWRTVGLVGIACPLVTQALLWSLVASSVFPWNAILAGFALV